MKIEIPDQPRTIALAEWAANTSRSALQQMLSVASHPDVISFALGLPAPELFPVEAYGRAAAEVLASDARALQYSPPFQPLKRAVVELMALRGAPCCEEQVFLTAGAQQGMSLLARVLLNQGGRVVCEELTYTGFQQMIEPFQPEILTVPTDPEHGMDLAALEYLLEHGARPAFIYAMPEGHNPLGACLSLKARARLAELAAQFRVPVIEDDAYGFLRYDGENLPPVRSFSEQWVCYVGSFSKILAPALRVGWLVVPEELIPALSVVKEASDIDTATFTQRTVAAYLASGLLPGHIESLRRAYGARRDLMLESLGEHFPSDAQWNRPQTGVFVWVDLGGRADTYSLLASAVENERVAFIPGQAFSVGGRYRGDSCLRMNFSHSQPRSIEEGVARLARAIARA